MIVDAMYALVTVLVGVLIGIVIAFVVNIRRIKAAVRELDLMEQLEVDITSRDRVDAFLRELTTDIADVDVGEFPRTRKPLE